MNNINVHCQGESHKAADKPCQDYSYSYSSDELSIAIVCDGHGGERYFRSQWGSKFATEVIVDVVKEFVRTTSKNMFRGIPFTAEGVVTGSEKKLSLIDKEMRQMFSSIITRWEEKIRQHAADTPVSEWEQENVPKKHVDEFLSRKSLEKHYGCTLMTYVQTSTYWFAFHLGDGKCIAFHDDDKIWSEPIPWDDKCFLNKTTSICDSEAINEFRYCYEGDGKFPVAVFLGSDGIDDTYGEMENIANFYVEIMKILAKDGVDTASRQLKDDLPIISRIGSKDDVSVAVIFNLDKVKHNIGKYIQFQIDYMTRQAEEQKERIDRQQEKKRSLKKQIVGWVSNKEKAEIELTYANQELQKATDRLEVLSGKIDFLSKEYKNFTNHELKNRPDYSETLEMAKQDIEEKAEMPETEGQPDIIQDETSSIRTIVVQETDDTSANDGEPTYIA